MRRHSQSPHWSLCVRDTESTHTKEVIYYLSQAPRSVYRCLGHSLTCKVLKAKVIASCSNERAAFNLLRCAGSTSASHLLQLSDAKRSTFVSFGFLIMISRSQKGQSLWCSFTLKCGHFTTDPCRGSLWLLKVKAFKTFIFLSVKTEWEDWHLT